MRRTVVINAVGLTPELIDTGSMPNIQKFVAAGRLATVSPVLPAVTCSVQATYLTGTYPDQHGIVGNGWYFRDECEVKFWRQSNKLVEHPKIWEQARQIDPTFTCANLFWWYNMYSTADYTVTPRPMYPADGRKIPDVYTQPATLRDQLQAEFGTFPLFEFWGPNTTIRATQWIANAARWIETHHQPTLSLVYLPHLDYCIQRFGPDLPNIQEDLQELDSVCGDLIRFYEGRGIQIILLSEYGITPVSKPVHLNRMLREKGYLAVREELGRELLDAGASTAFAVADHQFAHVYVNDPSRLAEIRALIEAVAGVGEVLGTKQEKAKYHLDHPRSGELMVLADPDAWFTYYYWLDDSRAPDFARTVDIHRKPGYDPVELFVDPAIRLPKLKAGLRLAQKQLGFRYLMDLISLDATLVKGSHGIPTSARQGAMIATRQRDLLQQDAIQATDVYRLMMDHLCHDQAVPQLETLSEALSGGQLISGGI